MEDKQFEQLVKMFHESEARSDKRFDSLEIRFSNLEARSDKRFDNLENRFSDLENQMLTGFDSMEKRFETAEQERQSLNSIIDRVEADLKSEINEVKDTVNLIDARLSGVEKKVA